MNNFIKIAASCAFLAIPTISHAGDDWTGFYLGAQLGGSGGNIGLDGDLFTDGISRDVDLDAGISYGLHAGYNWSLNNNYVVGAEISYDQAENEIVGIDVDVETTRLKVKGGFDQGGNLLYGVLGVASIEMLDASENGVTFGFGGSTKLKNNLVLSSEFLHDYYNADGGTINVNSIRVSLAKQF